MTVADLYQGVGGGGSTTVVVVLAIPLVVAVISLLLEATGHLRGSQTVANLGIAMGLAAFLGGGTGPDLAMDQRGVDPLADVSIFLLLAPLYLVLAAMFVEHVIHPGEQEPVRRRLRGLIFAISSRSWSATSSSASFASTCSSSRTSWASWSSSWPS